MDQVSRNAGEEIGLRVIVMGAPGSGKSTLAETLWRRLGAPVFHLDQAHVAPGWVEVPAAVFAGEVARMTALPGWVIDGNYTATIGVRLAAADWLIYLDVAGWVSVLRVPLRTMASYGRVRPTGPAGCRERFDSAFLGFGWGWNRVRRGRSLRLVEGFAGERWVLRKAGDRRRLFAAVDEIVAKS